MLARFRFSAFIFFFSAALLLHQNRAVAGPVQWATSDGGNGHYFDLVMPVSSDSSYTWVKAELAASGSSYDGLSGHLATVTSGAENDFLQSEFISQLYDNGQPGHAPSNSKYAWIGLYASTPFSGFEWVTGQQFSYSNWAPLEPNFYGTPDWQYVHYWTRDFGNGPDWSWNNEQNAGYEVGQNNNIYGYIVEYDNGFYGSSTPLASPEPSSVVSVGIAAIVVLLRRAAQRITQCH